MKRFARGFSNMIRTARAISRGPYWSYQFISKLPDFIRAMEFCQGSTDQWASAPINSTPPGGPLWTYFDTHKDGLAIFKWVHYFDIYERHFCKFVGRDVHLLEIGVLGGGSLEMWQHYLGSKCRVTGVDIDARCKAYENERTRIFIGDQEDRRFWKRFREQAPPVDILIDDGGHTPEQQMVTLEEMLPHIRPGGVYLCEDVHGANNTFAAFALSLARAINAAEEKPAREPDFPILFSPSGLQAAICSFHFYPFAVVIEKTATTVREFTCCARGTLDSPGG